MKILIIEDEIELLIAISNYLTKESFVCELAENFNKAIEKLSIYEYDIILLDITLPDGNGLDLLSSIKNQYLNQ
ncbi:MAG TPA: response regulator [Bacteroidales bacterium]|nr:response regulator [Bacteroidales bacterium]